MIGLNASGAAVSPVTFSRSSLVKSQPMRQAGTQLRAVPARDSFTPVVRFGGEEEEEGKKKE